MFAKTTTCKTTTCILLAATVLATGLTTATPASAANEVSLHELLFNRAKREKRRQQRAIEQAPAPAPQQVNRVTKAPARKIVPVSGPKYYDYPVPAVERIALLSLLPDTTTTGGIASATQTIPISGLAPLPMLDDNRFADALKHVPDQAIAIEPAVAEAVRKHYADNPAFVWVTGMAINDNGKAVAALLADASAHGLKNADYDVSLPADGWSMDDPAGRYGELLQAELVLTARAIRFAMDIKDGVINPNRLSGYHDFPADRLTPDGAIAGLSGATDPAAWLSGLAPQQLEYTKLAGELVALRAATDNSIAIPEGTFLRPGDVGEGVSPVIRAAIRKASPDIRVKHMATIDAYGDGNLYDGALVDLIKDVQREFDLKPDGVVGPATIARLGTETVADRIAKVELAMERMRWHPEQFGQRHVVINQPEYRVRYMENGETKLAMRAVVGQPENQTYFFHDEIETVVYNPYWGVPQSIIVNEFLPKLHRDPGYLDRAGYVVTGGNGKPISSSAINWRQYSGPVPYSVRQKPGPKNALGDVKILFPNSHAIYMHDTPARDLFSRDTRAFSHGCVRLERPLEMAAAVLGKPLSHVEGNLGGDEKAERVTGKIPVWVAYFTAWPDESGKVGFFPDVYKRDAHLQKALAIVDASRRS